MRIFSPSVSNTKACDHPGACVGVLQKMQMGVKCAQERSARADVFTSWLDPFEEIRPLEECCTSSQAMLKKRDWEARVDAWKKLPRVMGARVDGWTADAR